MMTLIGLTVSNPDHSFLKQRCPLKYMESTITVYTPSRRLDPADYRDGDESDPMFLASFDDGLYLLPSTSDSW